MQPQASAGLGSRPSSMGGAVPGLQVCGWVGVPWWMGGEGARPPRPPHTLLY
jgi:hypothetical protein